MVDSRKKENNRQAHKRLVYAINSLNRGRYVSTPTRNENQVNQSEFSLLKGVKSRLKPTQDSCSINDQTVKVADIVHVLKTREKHFNTGKLLKSVKKSKHVLKRPTEKPTAERIKRSIVYENVKKKLMKWDAVVSKNRSADAQVFPLPSSESIYVNKSTVVKPLEHTFASDLSKKMIATDEKMRNLKEINKACVTVEEDDDILNSKQLTRDELMARRRELRYLKMKQSQIQSKLRMQNKVKSKKYHKILKREKMRKESKDFELLQKSNPEAALEKLQDMEKNRVYERASLRHKNTGTWAKNLQMRAKYDKTVRKELSEQLQISREMTKRKQSIEDDNNEVNEVNKVIELSSMENEIENYPFNPWTKVKDELKNIDNTASDEKNSCEYWDGTNKNKKKVKNLNCVKTKSENNENTIYENGWLVEKLKEKTFNKGSKEQLDEIFDKKEQKLKNRIQNKMNKTKNQSNILLDYSREPLLMQNKNISDVVDPLKHLNDLHFKNVGIQRPKIDEEHHTADFPGLKDGEQSKVCDSTSQETKNITIDMPKLASINLQKYSNRNSIHEINLNLDGQSFIDTANDVSRIESDQDISINKIFEDDDIIGDCRAEKHEPESDVKNSEVNLSMPGWGSWAGAGLKANEGKDKGRKNLLLQLEVKKKKGADANKNNVYINEDSPKELRSHLVSDLPFPFKRGKDFEASVNASVGRNFVSETVFRLLTRPSIRTRKGQMSKPMDESEILKSCRPSKHIVDKRIADAFPQNS